MIVGGQSDQSGNTGEYKAARRAKRVKNDPPSTGGVNLHGEEQYRAIFEQSMDSIVIVNEDGSLADFNTAAHKNLGYTREEFQKLTIADLEAVESPEEVKAHIAKILRDGAGTFATKQRTKHGEILDVIVVSRIINVSGTPVEVSVWRDVTEQKEAVEALERKNVALQEILAQVQAAKDQVARRITANIDKIVMPMLHDLQRSLPPQQHNLLEMLEKSLQEITQPLAGKLSASLDGLTSVEVRICDLLRRGMSTKDIAQVQHISPATVSKHRENIRRKLSVTGKHVNLVTHLNALMAQDAHQQ
jgi:PAS domain S-box-containing protein